MSNKDDVLMFLKGTKKGKLNYDRASIEKYTFTPSISLIHSKSYPLDITFTGKQLANDSFDDLKETYSDENEEKVDRDFEKEIDTVDGESLTENEFSDFKHNDVDISIKNLDYQYENTVQANIRKRLAVFLKHDEMIKQQADIKLLQCKLEREQRDKNMVENITEQNITEKKEVESNNQKLKEKHIRHAQLLNKKMLESEAHKRAQEEDDKKRKEEIVSRTKKFKELHSEIITFKELLSKTLDSCLFPKLIQDATARFLSISESLMTIVNNLSNNAAQLNVSESHLSQIAELRQQFKQAVNSAVKFVQDANDRGTAILKAKEEEAKKLKEIEDAKVVSSSNNITPSGNSNVSSSNVTSSNVTSSNINSSNVTSSDVANKTNVSEKPKGLSKLDSELSAFQIYVNLQTKYEKANDEILSIVNDLKLKNFRTDLKKVIKGNLNTISNIGGSEVLKKLDSLLQLLSGKRASAGKSEASISFHPSGGLYCKILLMQTVLQSNELICKSNKNMDQILPLSSVIISLWAAHPDFGELILAHFHKACPYTVPHYPSMEEGQSEIEYVKSIGYHVSNNIPEKKNHYHNRMAGYMKLYVCIMITTFPKGHNYSHPHGIENLWMLLTRLLNLEPRADITTMFLMNIMEIGGHFLWKEYGSQFSKVLYLMDADYISRIEAVDNDDATAKLKILVKEALRSNSGPPPCPMLPRGFWES